MAGDALRLVDDQQTGMFRLLRHRPNLRLRRRHRRNHRRHPLPRHARRIRRYRHRPLLALPHPQRLPPDSLELAVVPELELELEPPQADRARAAAATALPLSMDLLVIFFIVSLLLFR